jgi:hypothetical protein
VVEKWVEFEVLRPINAEFIAGIVGSEHVLVEVRDAQGVVARPLAREISRNRCFTPVIGKAQAKLSPGTYEVRIGAKATGPDLLRSFAGKNFSITVLR